MVLYLRLFRAAVGWIHQNHIDLIVLGIVQHITQQSVVVEHLRHVQIMQQHICDAKHIGKLLFLDAVNRVGVLFFVFCGFDFFLQLFQPACDESTRTAGKVCHSFPNLGVNHLRHKIRYSARRVKFASRASALQFL